MQINIGESEGFWTFERIGMLVIYHTQGLSSGEIASLLRTTRNAICGKISRLRLAPPLVSRPPPRVETPREIMLKLHRHRAIPAQDLAASAIAPVPFLDRREDQCASVLNARGADGAAMVCGRPTCMKGSPWCAEHFLLYTQPAKDPPDGETRNRYQQF